MLLEYKTAIEAKLEEAKIWEEKLIKKQWWIQARNEATSRRNAKDDETNDGNDAPKTSPTLVAHP